MEADTMDEVLAKRSERAAESILANEKLTADLDDFAADALLDWGIACANHIVQNTVGMNDVQAEEAMYQPMRAVRRLMRTVTRWLSRHESMSKENVAYSLSKVIEQMGVIIGEGYVPPSDDRHNFFVVEAQHLASYPFTMITKLRRFVENEANQ
jgi:hypothetical protein